MAAGIWYRSATWFGAASDNSTYSPPWTGPYFGEQNGSRAACKHRGGSCLMVGACSGGRQKGCNVPTIPNLPLLSSPQRRSRRLRQTHFNFAHGGSSGYSSCVAATVTCSIRRSSPLFLSHRAASPGPRIRRPRPYPEHTAVAIRPFGYRLRASQRLVHLLWHQSCHDPAKSSARPAPEDCAGLRELQTAKAEGSVTHSPSPLPVTFLLNQPLRSICSFDVQTSLFRV